MPAVTIRNLPDDVHRALKLRAMQHNRSAEAEIRAILESAVKPDARLKLGTALSRIGRTAGLSNADIEALDTSRDRDPAQPIRL